MREETPSTTTEINVLPVAVEVVPDVPEVNELFLKVILLTLKGNSSKI